MQKIILATINARHMHASLGLRYLLANMGDLQPQTEIREFTLESREIDIAEQLLDAAPAQQGFRQTPWWAQTRQEIVANVALNIFTNYFNHIAGTSMW